MDRLVVARVRDFSETFLTDSRIDHNGAACTTIDFNSTIVLLNQQELRHLRANNSSCTNTFHAIKDRFQLGSVLKYASCHVVPESIDVHELVRVEQH